MLNRAFDYRKYLETLHRDGLNLTRTFVGGYVENPTAFDITRNTLAPRPASSSAPGNGAIPPATATAATASTSPPGTRSTSPASPTSCRPPPRRNVIVEVNLFCPFYGDEQWELSPWGPDNNVNGLGHVARTDAYTLDKSPELLAVQEAMTRKVVTELNGFDNVYYEICNEPYFGGVTVAWQAHLAEVIAAAEAALPKVHLISQNIANGTEQVTDPDPHVSLLNFHYASPPEAVGLNYGLHRAIGDNETGFQGTGDTHYRMEGWEFLLAGGGLYNHLDYSFTVGHEDGTFPTPTPNPVEAALPCATSWACSSASWRVSTSSAWSRTNPSSRAACGKASGRGCWSNRGYSTPSTSSAARGSPSNSIC